MPELIPCFHLYFWEVWCLLMILTQPDLRVSVINPMLSPGRTLMCSYIEWGVPLIITVCFFHHCFDGYLCYSAPSAHCSVAYYFMFPLNRWALRALLMISPGIINLVYLPQQPRVVYYFRLAHFSDHLESPLDTFMDPGPLKGERRLDGWGICWVFACHFRVEMSPQGLCSHPLVEYCSL